MIWTLIRIVIFVAIVGLLALGFGALADQGGMVIVQLLGVEVSMTPSIATLLILLRIFILWLVQKLVGLVVAVIRFLNGDETAVGRYFSRNRQKRAFALLADSMTALATGDGKSALTAVKKAERILPNHTLTHFIGAQSAHLAGNEKRSLHYYKQLLDNKRTRFAALQGLIHKKLSRGEESSAQVLAEKAVEENPKHAGSLSVLMDLQIKTKDWAGAMETLAKQTRAKVISREVGRRRGAILSLARASVLLDAGDINAGKALAIQANKAAPALVPAAILAAEMAMLDNSPRVATRILRKSWTLAPHPDSASAFATLAPDETAKQRLRRFSGLLKAVPEHVETHLLRAELLLQAEDFPSARRALNDTVEDDPTLRSLSLMAAIERGEGAADHVVRSWLNKALDAPRGAQWICGNCHNIAPRWAAVCPNCGGFDRVDWTRAKSDSDSDSDGTDNTLGFTASLMSEKI